jgi:hypothetical protein
MGSWEIFLVQGLREGLVTTLNGIPQEKSPSFFQETEGQATTGPIKRIERAGCSWFFRGAFSRFMDQGSGHRSSTPCDENRAIKVPTLRSGIVESGVFPYFLPLLFYQLNHEATSRIP